MTTKTRKQQPVEIDATTVHANGVAPAEVKPREVCLLGYAEETRELANSLPEHVQIYGINMAGVFLKNRTGHTWFQLHPRDWTSGGGPPTGYWGRPKEHLDFLRDFKGTVWMMHPDDAPEVPNRRLYPMDEIVRVVGRKYFTSTFAYQLALILWEHKTGNPVSRLYLYGINLTSMDEYAFQKPAAEYWLGRCEEAGIAITIPDASGLLKGPLYGQDRGDMAHHSRDWLAYWRDRYHKAWSDATTASAMLQDGKYWADKLSEILSTHLAAVPDDVKAAGGQALAQAFADRERQVRMLMDKSVADLNGALGVVKTVQHYLTLAGGVDFKALALPEARFASSALAKEFAMPTELRRI